tara:strand:- start:52 stop:252 length:201 start_codon:yes stop_codon:yes gene_type:complete
MFLPKSVRTKLATETPPLGMLNKEVKKCPLRGCFGEVERVGGMHYRCIQCETEFKGRFIKYLKVKR